MTDVKKEVEWVKQTGSDRWDPKTENEEIMGEIIEVVEGNFGTEYTLRTIPDGEVVKLPSHKVLQNRMSKVSMGMLVKIKYLGEELPKVKGQNPTRMYDVYIAK